MSIIFLYFIERDREKRRQEKVESGSERRYIKVGVEKTIYSVLKVPRE
jgi:hypothetical protein